MNLKVAIIDPQKSDIEHLIDFIHYDQKELLIDINYDIFYSGTDFFNHYSKDTYHLIFLNVFMENKKGIEIARRIRGIDKNVRIVLTGETPEFALAGYEVHAYAYLLKPFSYPSIIRLFEETIFDLNLQKPYINVKENRCNIRILLEDIIYVDVDNHYLQIHTPQRIIRTYMRFRDFEPMLDKYSQFLCCYRNVLVNMDHIETADDMDFKMDNGDYVPIKRNAKQEMRQKFADYQFEKAMKERN